MILRLRLTESMAETMVQRETMGLVDVKTRPAHFVIT